MNRNGNGGSVVLSEQKLPNSERLHPAWNDFIRYCEKLQFGDLEKVKIQNGLPIMVEVTTHKMKFGS